jgi:shikimate kinase
VDADTPRPPRLVFLYGPPAVGKLTVAQALAERLPFRILHNHVTLDPVAQVLTFGTPVFWQVVGDFRRSLARAAAREGVDLIYTFVFAPGDEGHVADIVGAFDEQQGTVLVVQLSAPREELLRRVTSESRTRHAKIADPVQLDEVLRQYDDFTADIERTTLRIDLGTTTAVEAAEQIVRELARGQSSAAS